MGRTALTVLKTTPMGTGLVPVAADGVNGNQFFNDGDTVLCMTNLTAGPLTVKIYSQKYEDGDQDDGLKVPDRVYTVPAGANILGGPFPQKVYNDPVNNVWVDAPADILLVAVSISFEYN